MEVGEKDKEKKTINKSHGSDPTVLPGDLLERKPKVDAHKSLGLRITL